MKFLYLFLVIISLYFIGIKAEYKTIDKQKIFSLKIQSCKEDKDCTDYSSVCNENVGLCLYNFYCHDNSCLVPDTNNTNNNISYIYEEKATGIILEVCSPNSLKDGNCSTRSCSRNSDCFTNNCFNNTCITNENLPSIRCSNDEHEEKITCGKDTYEKCEKDKECYSETCNEDKTCNGYHKFNYDKTITAILVKYFIILAIIVIIIIVICVLLCKRCNKKH